MRLWGVIFLPAFPAILLLAGNIPCSKLSPALKFLSRIHELWLLWPWEVALWSGCPPAAKALFMS